LLYKIDFERRTVYEGAGGKIVGFALFANEPKKATTTYLSIAASPLEFESYYKSGLICKVSTQDFRRG
jgi:hypothetical protein